MLGENLYFTDSSREVEKKGFVEILLMNLSDGEMAATR